MAWIDSHTHINDKAFDGDINEVYKRMLKADVLRAMVVSLNVEEFYKSAAFKHPGLLFDLALGIYPGDVSQMDEKTMDQIYDLCLNDKRIKAIGEIGLDYHWRKDNKDLQKAIFIKQIELANKLHKPIIVHTRDAVKDTYDILKAHPVKGVMHCFSESKEMAREFVKLGMYISFSGTLTFKNAKEPKEALKVVPLDRLLIETDAPYLSPVPYRGKRNEPSFVAKTGECAAQILGIDPLLLQKQMAVNYQALFLS